MKKQPDIGLQHIQRLGIKAAKNPNDIITNLTKVVGSEELAINLYENMHTRDGSIKYNKKNACYDIGMAVSGSYDADIIRKSCNWINEHKEYFGKDILEVGCDCGFMTTFLASEFPDSHITAIDRSQKGIDIAKQNVEKLGLTNVSFECSDVKDLNKRFDTVFSMRTMHENCKYEECINSIDDFQIQGKEYKSTISDYVNAIDSVLAKNGQLLSIERCERSPLFLGWLEALAEHDLFLKVNSYEELKCLEVGEINEFQALIINHEENNRNIPYESFLWCATKYMDTSLSQYRNWEALCMFEIQRGEKIKEEIFLGPEDIPVMKLSCWTHKSDKTGLLYLQDNGQEPVLSFYDISQKSDVLANMKEVKNQAIAIGYKTK